MLIADDASTQINSKTGCLNLNAHARTRRDKGLSTHAYQWQPVATRLQRNMARCRQPIRSYALFFIVKFRTSSTFYSGGIPKCPYSTRHLSCPRQSALSVSENEDDDIFYTHIDNDRKYWASRLEQQLNRQRRRRINHQESRITAAGAESLFSLSLWSFFSESSFKPIRKDVNSYIDNTHRADLPPIDCGWACHSDEEKIQLQQMKLLLGAEMKVVVNSKLHRLYPDVYSDLRLLRFLRKSKERDIVSSSERYRSFLKWREENNVDKIRAMVESNHGESSFIPPDDSLQRVAAYFPMKFDYVIGSATDSDEGSSKESNTVRPAILYVGSFDTFGISERIKATESNISLDDFLNYWIYLYESIHFHLYQQSIHFGKMMFLDEVCDLSGLSLQQFSPYFVTKVMKPWLKMTQSNYPETTRRIYILKPPAIVNLAWNLVAPLLSQGTVDKIRFEKKFKGTADDFCDNSDYN